MTEPRRSIFITGAASGMGRETARLFVAKGWFVGACDVNELGLKDLQWELGWQRDAGNFSLRISRRTCRSAAIQRFGIPVTMAFNCRAPFVELGIQLSVA